VVRRWGSAEKAKKFLKFEPQFSLEEGLKKVIAASSSSVYGDGSYFPTDEKHPFNNYLFYGATKVADEQLYRAFYKKYGLDYVAFRYLNIYGPRMDFRGAYMMVIMNFLNKLDAGEAPAIFGDGSATLDLVYVEDAARANLLALESDVTNEVFNVASGKETTLKGLLDLILKLTGSKLTPVYQKRDENLVVRRWGSAEKAKKFLKFEPQFSLEEGLKKVIVWRNDQTNKSNT
jgi:UDP-glucose 4-epimerase